MKRLPKPKSQDLLSLYRSTVHINENEDERNMKMMETDIANFAKDHKEIQNHLKTFKKLIKSIVPLKDQQNSYYRKFSNFLEQYEDANVRNTTKGE